MGKVCGMAGSRDEEYRYVILLDFRFLYSSSPSFGAGLSRYARSLEISFMRSAGSVPGKREKQLFRKVCLLEKAEVKGNAVLNHSLRDFASGLVVISGTSRVVEW